MVPSRGIIDYSSTVKNLCAPLLYFACFCLLAMQIGGVHHHLERDGAYAGLHGDHALDGAYASLHGDHALNANAYGHDHSAERDVPAIQDLGLSWSKLLPLILAFAVLIASDHGLRRQPRPLPAHFPKPRRRSRWRPPLRAPPPAP